MSLARAAVGVAEPGGVVLSVLAAWDSDQSPFPGLEAFTEQDSAVFCGRDAEITEPSGWNVFIR